MHISPSIPRSKDNQPMKFGQLIECNMRNIFLEKPCTKPNIWQYVINLIYQINSYFLQDQKVTTKVYLENEKSF